jgi:hypothetical protein
MIMAVADTAQVCTPLLTTYIRYGADNDRGDVEKLQYFLKTVEHEDAVTLTGVYDAPTRDAVRDLQRRYAADILTPWGLTKTTGYVYYTTQKKINELWCTDRAFPLTAAQEAEIEHFKAQAEAYRAAGTEVPETMRNEVGMAPSDHGSALATAALTNREEHGDLAEPTTADHKNADRTNNSQLAAAGAALKASAAQSIWSTVRDRLAGLWSWIGR